MSVVGGWAVPYVGVFFVLWEMNLFFVHKISASHWLVVLESTTLPTAAHLCPLLPYVLLHCCRTAALLLYCFFNISYHRGYSTNLFFSTIIPAGNWQTSGEPLVSSRSPRFRPHAKPRFHILSKARAASTAVSVQTNYGPPSLSHVYLGTCTALCAAGCVYTSTRWVGWG